jgi:hypothetical protein
VKRVVWVPRLLGRSPEGIDAKGSIIQMAKVASDLQARNPSAAAQVRNPLTLESVEDT